MTGYTGKNKPNTQKPITARKYTRRRFVLIDVDENSQRNGLPGEHKHHKISSLTTRRSGIAMGSMNKPITAHQAHTTYKPSVPGGVYRKRMSNRPTEQMAPRRLPATAQSTNDTHH